MDRDEPGCRQGASRSWRKLVGLRSFFNLILPAGAALVLFAGVVLGQEGAAGEQPSSSIPKIVTDVREVLVPVVVTDKKGHHINSLHASDFEVFEDGIPQRIAGFNTSQGPGGVEQNRVASPETEGGGAASLAPKHQSDTLSRTYLVCVDSVHSSFGNWAGARKALARFFAGERDSEAQYALMNMGRRLQVIQDSTRDPEAILKSVQSKKFQGSILDSEAFNISVEKNQLRNMLKDFSESSCRTPAVRVQGQIPDNCSAIKLKVKAFIDTSAERTSILTRAFLRELDAVVDALAVMPTARTLILISDGFNLVPGQELYGIAAAYFPDTSQWRSNQRETQSDLDVVLKKAEKNNVVIYTLDSRGLYTLASMGNDFDAASADQGYMRSGLALAAMDQQEARIAWENGSAMAELAAATGGIYFHNNNDLLTGLRRAFDDGRQRYMLAYVPTNTNLDGKFRKIRVMVRNQKLPVNAKAGYWATTKH